MTPHIEGALALHRRLAERVGDDTTLVWSPYSVASALGLVAAGARGKTRDELAAALAPGGDLDGLARLLGSAASVPDGTFAVSNGLWMQHDLPFHRGYQEKVLARPGGALHGADFRRDAEGARRAINADVEKTTRGLIRELLVPGVLHPEVVAVVANALYLKVAWMRPFLERATVPRTFHAVSGTREVPTMEQRERMSYAAAEGWRMATLPAEGDVVADVLLPDDELVTAERRLSAESLSRLYGARREAEVGLRLPRFRVEGASGDLTEPLRLLGVRAAFDPAEADFSGIAAARLWIDTVIHKAVLRVDEQGLEGAAATAVVMRTVSAWLGESVDLHVDRPFLVIVRHATSGALYFLARVTDPG
ncbi:MAG: serpin family protein [Streptosporangiales bacterium]|nr:serpin family protein [Streptosporangiales bacterium]